jgi:Ras-related GTP-binding protein A/B
MEIKLEEFACFIDILTPNTYAMIILSNPEIEPAVIKYNIQAARKQFEKLELAA